MEILSPAGGIQALKSAVQNGANAVYLGLDKYSARAKSDEFTLDNLQQYVDYCHLYNVKVYLAMNTLIKQNEMSDAVLTALTAWNMGIDAIIAQDLGFCRKIKSTMPDIVLHASTQMGICNLAGAIVAQEIGFERVVLARECSLNDVMEIKAHTNLEVEFFVHGALCLAFSGNCYFSSQVSGLSGNRGRCLQLCRKKYTINGSKGYYLSCKDLCLLEQLTALKNAGVDSIKIEGRLRSSDYVANVTAVYAKTVSGQYEERFNDILKASFNRGDYTLAGLQGENRNTICADAPNNTGLLVGQVVGISGKNLSIKKLSNFEVDKNTGYKIMRDNIDVCGASYVDDSHVGVSENGACKIGDEVRVTSIGKQIFDNLSKRKLNVSLAIDSENGVVISTKIGDMRLEASRVISLENTKNASMNVENVISAIEKSGDDYFEAQVDRESIDIDDKVFVPLSVVKAIRRKLIVSAKQQILNNYVRAKSAIDAVLTQEKYAIYGGTMSDIAQDNVKKRYVILSSKSQLCTEVYDFADVIIYSPKEYSLVDLLEFKDASTIPVYLNLPNFARNDDVVEIDRLLSIVAFDGVVINNIYALKYVSQYPVIYGKDCNLINSYFVLGDKDKILSIESAKKTRDNDILYAFGKVRLMTFTHCISPKKNCNECITNGIRITDDTHQTFEVQVGKVKNICHHLYNSVPLDMTKNFGNIMRESSIVCDFTAYDKDFISNFLDNFKNGIIANYGEYTNGLFGKGVK